MRFVNVAAVIAIAAMTLLPTPTVLGQSDLGSPLGTEHRFQAETPPAQAEIVHLVLDFEPGVWLPLHKHGGPGYATVLSGVLTRRAEGTERTFSTGEGWVDTTDLVHQAGNDTALPARIVATFVIPKGAALTTLVESDSDAPPGPGATTVAEYLFDVTDLPSPLDLVHRDLQLPPASQIPPHSPPGVTLLTVIQGNGTLTGGEFTREFAPGQSWVELGASVPGSPLIANEPVNLIVTDLLPRGAAYGVASKPATEQLTLPASERSETSR